MPGQPRDLARALEGLVAIAVATRDAALRPTCLIAVGVAIDPDRPHLTVFVPDATSGALVANLAASDAIAVVLDRPATHRSVQVKGRCTSVRPARPEEQPVVESCMEAFFATVEELGVPPLLVRRQRGWPCVALGVEVEQVFEQTPGPRAGCLFPPPEAA